MRESANLFWRNRRFCTPHAKLPLGSVNFLFIYIRKLNSRLRLIKNCKKKVTLGHKEKAKKPVFEIEDVDTNINGIYIDFLRHMLCPTELGSLDDP